MKIIFCVISLLFLNLSILAQAHSGNIIYSAEIPHRFEEYVDTTEIKEPILRSVINKRYIEFRKTAPYIKHKVKFNSEQAVGSSNEGMAGDNNVDLNNTMESTYAFGEYYFDLVQRSSTHQFKGFGKLLRVMRSMDSIPWKILEEQKNILGYRCRRASASYSFNYLVENKIIAWFCPDLPFQIGPIGIGGLPGAILRLEVSGFSFAYQAKEIKL